MAVEVMTWVFNHSRSKNAERLVMLAIADACNKPDGTGAWLSNAALCAKTNLSERAVQAAVASCEQRLGELSVQRGQGRGGVNKFKVIMLASPKPPRRKPADSAPLSQTPQNLHPAESAPISSKDPQVSVGKPADSAPKLFEQKGAESAPGTVSNSSTKSSSIESANKPKTRGTRIPDDFHATAAMIAWARENTPHVGAKETDAFIDHFRGAPGAKGVKVEWVGTWRNWMRREQKRLDEQKARAERFPGNGAGYRSAASNAPKRIPEQDRCPEHPRYPATTCGPCRSNRLAAGQRA